jgi:ribosomal protein S18 acetylase RimI-like enzyme
MQPWTVEYGTLWAVEPSVRLPPICSARVEAEFEELRFGDAGDLATAMNLPTPEPILRRLQNNRRCFSLKVAGQIASYGWVTRGTECVGELERQFNLHDDEAYIWHCGTLPAWRGQRCYSALLNQLIYRLHHEGVPRIWIGASLQNQPSIRAFANAGFQPVVDVAYRRLYYLTLMWIHHAPSARRTLVSAAYRILLNNHERRLGQLIIGYNHK